MNLKEQFLILDAQRVQIEDEMHPFRLRLNAVNNCLDGFRSKLVEKLLVVANAGRVASSKGCNCDKCEYHRSQLYVTGGIDKVGVHLRTDYDGESRRQFHTYTWEEIEQLADLSNLTEGEKK